MADLLRAGAAGQGDEAEPWSDRLERERQRLAREIHDGPAQLLTNLAFHLEVVERLIGSDDARARQEVRELRQEALAAATEMRRFLYELVPPGLAQGDLGEVLTGHIDRLQRRFGLAIHLDAPPDLALDAGARLTLFRVVQEALQNVLRHGGTAEAWVTVRPEGDEVVAEVRDQGAGFDPAARRLSSGERFGLSGMRERAAAAGGSLAVDSRPGQGTRVTLRLPRSRPAGEGETDCAPASR